jgi:hypothetical protein
MEALWQAATTIVVTATQRGMMRGIIKGSIMLVPYSTTHGDARVVGPR